MVLALALVACIGCESGGVMHPDDEIDVNIETPEFGYIYFDNQTTRGTLIETVKDDQGNIIDDSFKYEFGVIGYTYIASDWSYAEVMTKPNVFANHPQKVTWDGSTHSYTPMQAWLGKQEYAFFAFYPSNLTVSGSDQTGNPYIDFTFPRGDLSQHIDVMTDDEIHVDYSTRSVGFKMQHRLSAIDLRANNIYNGVEIRITSMSITFNNLLYDKVRIPLNTRDKLKLDYYAGMASNKTATYNLLPTGKVMTIPADGYDIPITSVEGVNESTTMIVIPQDQYIDTNGDGTVEDFTMTGKVTVAYETYQNGTKTGSVAAKDYPFSMDRSLIGRQHYYIMLNFAEGDVTIAIIESESWESLPEDITHEFE